MTQRISKGKQEPFLLERVFKHKSFRGEQEQIIDAAMCGKDTLVLMPTGMGKSLCYQFPSVAGEGLDDVVAALRFRAASLAVERHVEALREGTTIRMGEALMRLLD